MVHATDIRPGGQQERRARRYDIAQPVRFRTPEGRWVNGTTVNMSASGVLIRTRQPLAPATEVVLQIALGRDASFRPQIGCSGHVARTEPISGTDDFLLAATIDNFQLRRGGSSADGDV